MYRITSDEITLPIVMGLNIYTGWASPYVAAPPPHTEGFPPPLSKVPFCQEMSENHAGIAGNQV